jgi:hypothetical protein
MISLPKCLYTSPALQLQQNTTHLSGQKTLSQTVINQANKCPLFLHAIGNLLPGELGLVAVQNPSKLSLMVIEAKSGSIINSSHIHHHVTRSECIRLTGANNSRFLELRETLQHGNGESFIAMKGAVVCSNGGVFTSGKLADHCCGADSVDELGEESGVHSDLFECRHNNATAGE